MRGRGASPLREPGTDQAYSDTLSAMVRLSFIVVGRVPRRVTHRGDARQFVLENGTESHRAGTSVPRRSPMFVNP